MEMLASGSTENHFPMGVTLKAFCDYLCTCYRAPFYFSALQYLQKYEPGMLECSTDIDGLCFELTLKALQVSDMVGLAVKSDKLFHMAVWMIVIP